MTKAECEEIKARCAQPRRGVRLPAVTELRTDLERAIRAYQETMEALQVARPGIRCTNCDSQGFWEETSYCEDPNFIVICNMCACHATDEMLRRYHGGGG